MNPKPPAPRKPRFIPKARNRKNIKSTPTPKIENVDDTVDDETQLTLLQRFNESRKRKQLKLENKAPVQVAFSNEKRQSTSTRAFGRPWDGALKQSSELDLMQLDDGIGKSSITSSCTSVSSVNIKGSKIKDYKEPWDYTTFYPNVVPWRIPYSGDPEILNEAEFGEDAREVQYDETTVNPAAELGFLNPDETGTNNRLLFFQLPQSLPAIKRSASAKGEEIAGVPQRISSLEDLAAGQMGKLLVYKSGAVKLKLGETLYDVSPGSNCNFAQDVAVINTKTKQFCEIGSLEGKAIVTPDIDSHMNSVIDLG